jgi:hypothetical protein
MPIARRLPFGAARTIVSAPAFGSTGDRPMMTFRIVAAAAVISMVVSVPAMARSHHHHRHHRHHSSAADIYLHNYGPAVAPDQTFAYYDGPAGVRCKQSAASYRGQDGRRHPCN